MNFRLKRIFILCSAGFFAFSFSARAACEDDFTSISTSELANDRTTIRSTHSKSAGMNTLRGLDSYTAHLGEQFETDLKGLRSSDVFLDSGGGEGRALDQYRERGGLGTRILISFETAKEPEEGLRVLKERLLEEIPDTEIGPVNIGTDVMGPYSYSKHPEMVIAKYSRLLKDERSKFFIGSAPVTDAKSTVFNPNGKNELLGSWLGKYFDFSDLTKGPNVSDEWSVYKLGFSRQAPPPVPKLIEVWRDRNFPPNRIFLTNEQSKLDAPKLVSEQKEKSRVALQAFLESNQKSKNSEPLSWWNESLAREVEKREDQSWLHVSSAPKALRKSLEKRISDGPAEKSTGWRAALGIKTQHRKTKLDLKVVEKLSADLPKFDTISDFQGDLFFHERPDLALADYFAHLKEGGRVLLYRPADPSFARGLEKAILPVILVEKKGGETTRTDFISWLRENAQVKVSLLDEARWVSIEPASGASSNFPKLDFLGYLNDNRSGLDAPTFIQKSE